MTAWLALVRLELAVLFGSPLAWLALTGFAGVNAPPRQYGMTVRLNFGAGSFNWF